MNDSILPPNKRIEEKLRTKIDSKTKPVGSLGKLEEIALQIGLIQQSLTPKLINPHIIVFSGDHGIANEGVSPFPQEVTQQMFHNFIHEGAAINVFARQNQINIKVVDSGVIGEFSDEAKKSIVDYKIANGTQSFLKGPAMTKDQCEEALQRGAKVVKSCKADGCNIIGFGEMGIGNTSSSAMLMHYITEEPLGLCVGKGTGLNREGIEKKASLLKESKKYYKENGSVLSLLAHYGGFEIAMITGAILEAAKQGMTILIDGFNVTAALLVAHNLESEVIPYCIFAHQSDEKGHKKMLDYLGVKPLLHLDLRLGEGTGAALVYPVIQSAVHFLNQMASFDQAGVSGKND